MIIHGVQVEGLGGVQELALAGSSALALALTGQLLVWGSNDNGVLGLGFDAAPNPAKPVPIKNLYFDQVRRLMQSISNK